MAEGVGLLMANAAPARSAGDVGALATFCAGGFADPVKVLLGPGPVPGTELMYRDVHKKLTHLFYNFQGTKRGKVEFADTKR